MTKLKVVAVSLNRNSFGLRNMVFISDDGRGFSALANDLNILPQGGIIELEGSVLSALTSRGFECSEPLSPDPDPALVREVWAGQ